MAMIIASQVYCITSILTRSTNAFNVCLYAVVNNWTFLLSYGSSDCLFWWRCETFQPANYHQLNTIFNWDNPSIHSTRTILV